MLLSDTTYRKKYMISILQIGILGIEKPRLRFISPPCKYPQVRPLKSEPLCSSLCTEALCGETGISRKWVIWSVQDVYLRMNQLLEEGTSRRCLCRLRQLTRLLRLGWLTLPKCIVQTQTHKTCGGVGKSYFSPAHDTPQSKHVPKLLESWSHSCTVLWPSPGHASRVWDSLLSYPKSHLVLQKLQVVNTITDCKGSCCWKPAHLFA